jgi:hypothetical protein
MTTEQYVVNHAMMIATYSGVAISFLTFLWLKYRHPQFSVLKKLTAGYVAAYVLFVAVVVAFDKYITYRVSMFDHDGDGVFQDYELVGDLGFFWDAMILDTGRNFAPLTGLFTSVISTALAFTLAVASARIAAYFRR